MKLSRQPQETGLCPRIGDEDPLPSKFNIWANELLDVHIVLHKLKIKIPKWLNFLSVGAGASLDKSQTLFFFDSIKKKS